MARNPAADHVVQLVTDPDRADEKIAVVADQILDAGEAAAGSVPTVQDDGTWGIDPLPISQVAALADLVDSTGGTVDGTLAALAAVGSPSLLSGAAAQDDVNARLATLNDNLADLAEKLNAALAALRSAGVLAE